MKFFNLLFLTCILFLFSCSDDDESPNYDLDIFIGEWELVASTDPEFGSCPDDPPILTISNSELSIPEADADNGCHSGSTTVSYEFTGSTFVTEIFGIDITMNIESASDTEFTWSYYGSTKRT